MFLREIHALASVTQTHNCGIGRPIGGMLLYSRDVPTGWIAIFRGGLELELRTDLPRPAARWFSPRGVSLGWVQWGSA